MAQGDDTIFDQTSLQAINLALLWVHLFCSRLNHLLTLYFHHGCPWILQHSR